MNQIKPYILITFFYLTSFFGFLLEALVYLGFYHKYPTLGFLPYLPLHIIYGFVVIIIYLLLKTPQENIFLLIKNKLKNKFLSNLIVLVLYSLLASTVAFIIEYSSGFVLDKFLHHKLWSYEELSDNINGYVSIRVLGSFGLISTLYMWHIFPRLVKFLQKVSSQKLIIINQVITFIIVIDIVLLIIL